MFKVTYIDLSGKSKETNISRKNQVKELDQLRKKGYSILLITGI